MEFPALPPVRPTLTHPDCTYAVIRGYRPLDLDLHLPPGDGPHPIVVWLHGGGWQEGSRRLLPETIEPFGLHERLVNRGYAVADVDYRLSREATYPAQLEDVQAAIAWLRTYASRFGLDPDRIATFGESAGGHLAALAGLLGHEETAVQAVVSWYSPSDLTFFDTDDLSTSPAALLGGAIGQRAAFARWASPLHHVHPAAPPFFHLHGTADAVVPYDQSARLNDALRAAGVRSELLPVAEAGHCFEGYADIGGLIDASIDFMDETLPHPR